MWGEARGGLRVTTPLSRGYPGSRMNHHQRPASQDISYQNVTQGTYIGDGGPCLRRYPYWYDFFGADMWYPFEPQGTHKGQRYEWSRA